MNWVSILAWLSDSRDGSRNAMTILRSAAYLSRDVPGDAIKSAVDFVSYFLGETELESWMLMEQEQDYQI